MPFANESTTPTPSVIEEVLSDFLDAVDFSAVIDENVDLEVEVDGNKLNPLVEDGIDAVVLDDQPEFLELTDESLAILAALDGVFSAEELTEAAYRAVSRGNLLKRMKNARVQTADERLRNRKARINRRRNRAKLKVQRVKRARRVGRKAELAAKRRGLGEAAPPANEGKGKKKDYDDEEEMDDEEDEDCDEVCLLVPSELIEDAMEALTRTGLLAEVEEVPITETEDEDGDAIDPTDYAGLVGSPAVIEALAAYLSGADLIETASVSGSALEAAEIIDLDDLTAMLAETLDDCAEATDLPTKVAIAAFSDLFRQDAELVDEAMPPGGQYKGTFKKGDFKKIHAGKKTTPAGKKGPEIINRMLGAMIVKGAIKKAKPGSGYTGGDYAKDKGYGPGTAPGIKAWLKKSGRTADTLGGNPAGATGVKSAVKPKKATKVLTGSKALAANKTKTKAVAAAAKKKKPLIKLGKVGAAGLAKLKALAAKGAALLKKGGKRSAKAEAVVAAVQSPINEMADMARGAMKLHEGDCIVRAAQPAATGSSPMADMARTLVAKSTAARTTPLALMESAPVRHLVRDLPGWTRIGKEQGVLYAPNLTEAKIRSIAKAAGWKADGHMRMAHEAVKGGKLLFLRDRVLLEAA